MDKLIPLLPIILAAAMPTADDAYTAIGAALAVVIGVKHADSKDKSLLTIICIVVSTFFIGIALPGSLIWYFKPSEFDSVTWHVWALMGFAAGLSGWGIAAGLAKFFNTAKFGKFILGLIFSVLKIQQPKDDDTNSGSGSSS